MEDRVQKIKKEIGRRMNNLWYLIPEGEKVLKDNFTKDDANNLGKYTALENLLHFIDSLPEESGCEANFTTKNEDLEEELDNFLKDPVFGKLTNRNAGMVLARHFADWQKQQMMKDACDTKITTDKGSIFPIIKYQLPLTYDCKIGDKVKIIIVKED